MSQDRLDIPHILSSLDLAEVVSRYIQITKKGAEYAAICPFHEDHDPSLRIIPSKGFIYCHACHWHGDAIGFVMDFTGMKFKDAVSSLNTTNIPLAPNAPRIARAVALDKPALWQPITPVPETAPEFDPSAVWNPKRDDWSAFRDPLIHAYRNAAGYLMGYVVRINTANGKITPQVTYCRNAETGEERWALSAMPRPRTLYGLEQLALRPADKVVITEGESCKDKAALLWPGMISIGWCGGTAGAKHTDWSPLYGRDVVLWPDNDEGGVLVMEYIAQELHEHGCKIRVVTIPGTERTKGWDVVDAIKDFGSIDETKNWVKHRLTQWTPPPVAPEPVKPLIEEFNPIPLNEPIATKANVLPFTPPPVSQPPMEEHQEGNVVTMRPKIQRGKKPPKEAPTPLVAAALSWQEMGMTCEPGKPPHCNEFNVAQVLLHHPAYKGKIWYDEFYQSIFSDIVEGDDKEWTEHLTMRLLMWLQGTLQMHKIKEQQVINAVRGIAFANKRHHLRSWLESLVWDGTPRLTTFMADAFGCAQNNYTAEVGRCWLTSMVARILWPGCQADYMPVLEGAEGLRKSSALNALASPYFAECYENVHGKAFQEHLQGVWLIEIAELHAFTSNSAEVEKVKGIITCRNDRFRAPWAKAVTKHLRQCIFSGTTNRDDWNRSDTGARRFWPVRCGIVNDEYIINMREQLFAEAVKKFKMFPADESYNDARVMAGADWWNVPLEDARREQEMRRDTDAWEGIISQYLSAHRLETITVSTLLEHVLEIKPADMDRTRQMRVARCLRGLGWRKEFFKDSTKKVIRGWVAPTRTVGDQEQLL